MTVKEDDDGSKELFQAAQEYLELLDQWIESQGNAYIPGNRLGYSCCHRHATEAFLRKAFPERSD